eukprot:363689-Chlamydomonas_euryale.AAC.9
MGSWRTGLDRITCSGQGLGENERTSVRSTCCISAASGELVCSALQSHRARVRIAGSGPVQGMPVLSAP